MLFDRADQANEGASKGCLTGCLKRVPYSLYIYKLDLNLVCTATLRPRLPSVARFELEFCT
jgi:hypothetical protein